MALSSNIQTRSENVHVYHVFINAYIFCAGRHVLKLSSLLDI